MEGEEVRRIREKLGLTRNEFAEIFGLSTYQAVSNIEIDFRRPSKLTIILLRVLDSLSKMKAQALIALLRKHANT